MKNDQNISVYEQSVHVYGRIWTGMALILMILAPVAICCYYNAWPPLTAVLKSLLGVAPMYWTVGIIEVFTFVPMLGTGGSYLGFVTGNLTNLKVPCALNAMEAAKVRPGSEEGEVISTIAIASSSIVTTLVIALGVFGLGFISKNLKLAAAPLAFMVVLFLLAPGLSSSVGVLVPVGALIAIGAARIMYKRGMLGGAPADGKEGRQ